MRVYSIIVCLSAAFAVAADAPLAPGREVYPSADGSFLFLVEPGSVGIEEGSGKPGVGTLFERYDAKVVNSTSPRFREVWRRYLVNSISPEGVLVASSGKYVITISDRGANVDESDAIVVYDEVGSVLHRLRLRDMFSADHLSKIPQIPSVVLWFYGGSIDEQKHTLEMRVWGSGTIEMPVYETVVLDLRTGKLM